MSRAFVNEDTLVGDVPDRPISPGPNYVTRAGLAQIDAELHAAQRAYGEGQASGDREALAKAARNVRYWNARRVSAQLVTPELVNKTERHPGKWVAISDGRIIDAGGHYRAMERTARKHGHDDVRTYWVAS